MSEHLGELGQLLLLALVQCGDEASGLDLRDTVAERAGRTVLPGAVYTIMERFRERGFVTAFTGEEAPERGGRRRKYYRLEPAGRTALARAYSQVHRMADGIGGDLLALGEGESP